MSYSTISPGSREGVGSIGRATDYKTVGKSGHVTQTSWEKMNQSKDSLKGEQQTAMARTGGIPTKQQSEGFLIRNTRRRHKRRKNSSRKGATTQLEGQPVGEYGQQVLVRNLNNQSQNLFENGAAINARASQEAFNPMHMASQLDDLPNLPQEKIAISTYPNISEQPEVV